MSSYDPRIDLAAVAALGYGLVLFQKGFSCLRLRRLVQGMATSKARSIAMGMVELNGTAVPFREIDDPIFGEPCVYYDIRAEEKRSSGKNSYWVEFYHTNSNSIPLYLEDDTGRVMIMPQGAQLFMREACDQTVGGLLGALSADVTVTRFAESIGASSYRPVRVRARILRPGATLYALGYAVPADHAPELPPGAPVPEVFVRQTPDGLLVLSDRTEKDFLGELAEDSFLETFAGPALSLAGATVLALHAGLIRLF